MDISNLTKEELTDLLADVAKQMVKKEVPVLALSMKQADILTGNIYGTNGEICVMVSGLLNKNRGLIPVFMKAMEDVIYGNVTTENVEEERPEINTDPGTII